MDMVEVKQSEMCIDLATFPNAYEDPGLGLFQRRNGRVTLLVRGHNVQSIQKRHMHRLQKKYAFQSAFDEDFVIVPTVSCIREGNIPVSFRVQHDSDDPTHTLDYHEDSRGRDFPFSYPMLVPCRTVKAGTELAFDYNL